jgi:1,4-dihydroxy-6-naphthoate synthase
VRLSLGYSPCPNDCFIFYALAHGKVAPELGWDVALEDVETLNKLARERALEVSKVSYSAYGQVMDDYVMLRPGGALGRGVGPLLVSKEPLGSLSGRRVAVPGGLTTANLLLQLWQEPPLETYELRYDLIMPAVARGEADAGLIIHESRFTYPDYGLRQVLDLGEWWQEETGLPLPLGGIMAKRSLGSELLGRLGEAVRASLHYAYAHRAEAQPYIAAHAQELDPKVMQRHIDLYVNPYSEDVGEDGERAVAELFRRARARGLMPPASHRLFV